MSARWLAVGLTLVSAQASADSQVDAGSKAHAAVRMDPAGPARLESIVDNAYRGQIDVTMRGFRSDAGRALLVLFHSAAGFPNQPPSRAVSLLVPIVNGVAHGRFQRVAPGAFAISVLQDEDGDGKLKKDFFGIPKEGVGYSRDPSSRFGPPEFDDCMVVLGRGKHEVMRIQMINY